MVKIHNIKFYKPDPKPIFCISLQKDRQKLALSRSNSCIEIWNLKHLPYIEKIIHRISNYNIEGLVWSSHRLFSCCLEGFLYEYDLLTLTAKQRETLVGEAAFCLDINKTNTNLVVGTEKGYLNVFDITENEIKFLKFLDKQDGRILCVKYDYTGKFIVSGSIDAIRIWDVCSGHALHKMATGRTEIHKSTIVWCLEVTSNFIIISGDSRGRLTFWDGKIGSQIESYQSHKADILSLALSEDEDTLFCAGVDATLISYVRINVKDQNKMWVKSIQRKVHDHDVRALVLFNNKLYSCGIDGYLVCSFHPPKTVLKYPPFLQNNCITICKTLKLIFLQYSTHIEIWKLGIPSNTVSDTGLFQLTNDPKKLLHLERSVKSDSNELYKETIICGSISSNGRWIAFSSVSAIKLYEFISDDLEKISLKPIKLLPAECEVSVKLIFTPGNEELILALFSGFLTVVNLKTITTTQKIEISTFFSDTILHLQVSLDGKYLIAADTDSNIVVWIKHSNIWKYYCKLPKYSCAPTALAVQPITNNLWISFSDHKIAEYSLRAKQFSEFSRQLDPKKISKTNKYFPIRNITFDLVNKDVILLHDDANIFVINKNKQSSGSLSKVSKMSKGAERHGDYFNVYKKYHHLVHLESLSRDEIIAVEVTPLSLMEQLPPCLNQNTFGTK